MKIKNVYLARLLTNLGVDVKAELVVDDATGTSLTFPDISDVMEIAEGVAVDAPDGTYVIPIGDEAWTIVVAAGLVSSVTKDTPTTEASTDPAELDAEIAAVLGAMTEEVVALKANYATVAAELKGLKASLKHDEPTNAPATAASNVPQFKLID